MSVVNIMLDLETLGTRPDSAILVIGACVFEPETCIVADKFCTKIDLEDTLRRGFSVDADTLKWWMMQSDEAKKEAFSAPAAQLMSVPEALANFGEWIYEKVTDLSEVRMWGNGIDFDNVLLAEAYKKMQMPLPWDFRGNRCFRTVKNLHSDVEKPAKIGISHSAIDDAIWQAIYLMDILKTKNIKIT